jgi:type IV pilus assembly protein PilM
MSLASFFHTSPPDVAVEVDADHVSAARLSWRGPTASVTAHAMDSLPAGLVQPAVAAPNIQDVAMLGRAVASVLSRLGSRSRRVALVVPDTIAKVSLVRFEKVPPRAQDLNELIRWQIKKSTPFAIDSAVVSYSPGVKNPDGQEFVVATARQDIVEQYEQACVHAGVAAGLVDLATFSIANGVLASNAPSSDWLLVHVTPTYTTLTVIRGGQMIFFRNRAEDAEVTLADVVHQTAMYYEDRLQGAGFTRVILAGAALVPGGADVLRRSLEERLGLRVDAVDPRTAAALLDRITASPEILDALAPLVGILVREKKVA